MVDATSVEGAAGLPQRTLGVADNIRASGRKPRSAFWGFAAAWSLFFFIAYLSPVPQGLSPAGMAVLAVVVWASIIWITEAIPAGVSGMLIPMLLILGGG